jgi:hypothetical protein
VYPETTLPIFHASVTRGPTVDELESNPLKKSVPSEAPIAARFLEESKNEISYATVSELAAIPKSAPMSRIFLNIISFTAIKQI